MKTKLIVVLLGLPLALLSFKKEDHAKALLRKAIVACDTAFLYPAIILKQAELNSQTPPKSLVVTDESGGSRAKLQMKAYLDSLTFDGSPAGSAEVKKDPKIKITNRQKPTSKGRKTNSLSRNATKLQNLSNRMPSDQALIPYDPDETNPMQSSAGSK